MFEAEVEKEKLVAAAGAHPEGNGDAGNDLQA